MVDIEECHSKKIIEISKTDIPLMGNNFYFVTVIQRYWLRVRNSEFDGFSDVSSIGCQKSLIFII